jgi:hypothetical protein
MRESVPRPVSDLGPISPELCLVDPELRAAVLGLPAPAPEARPKPRPAQPPLPALRRSSRPRPPVRTPEETPARRRSGRTRAAAPRIVAVAAGLVATIALVPSAAVHSAIPARFESRSEPHTSAPPAHHDTSVLVVPDVCRLVYVFAKGMLQDRGFAWHVDGLVQGYAADRVVRQIPAPGTVVADTGAPMVVLTLGHNPGFAERGDPQNDSPYPGTAVKSDAAGDTSPVFNGCEKDTPLPTQAVRPGPQAR